jgi:glucokinase
MYYLGIEIGGTKLQLGVGADDGKLAALWRGAVDVAAGPEGIRRQIVAAVPELLTTAGLNRAKLKGVGIGFGGPVDDATRTVIKSHQIEGWDGFPLADWILDVVGLPAALGNDADVAGLAEALRGAGKGLSPIFYITIGSGIGGGLIIDGEIYRGVGRGAAEIGHVRVPVLTKGFEFEMDPLESLVSGWALAKEAQRLVLGQGGPMSLALHYAGGEIDRMSAEHLGRAAADGEEFARKVLFFAWDSLAEGICHVITLLCPRRIVIGGGVALLGEKLLFEPLRRKVADRVFKPFAGLTDIVPAALGEEVVVHGAIALARRRLRA